MTEPIKCSFNGKPGYQWSISGRCYTYDPDDRASEANAREAAQAQGREVMERQRLASKSQSLPYSK